MWIILKMDKESVLITNADYIILINIAFTSQISTISNPWRHKQIFLFVDEILSYIQFEFSLPNRITVNDFNSNG